MALYLNESFGKNFVKNSLDTGKVELTKLGKRKHASYEITGRFKGRGALGYFPLLGPLPPSW